MLVTGHSEIKRKLLATTAVATTVRTGDESDHGILQAHHFGSSHYNGY